MAGDWIKMRSNLWDDPRVARLCDLTDQAEAAIVGALYWLWATADQHSEDGVLPGLTLRQIDRKTGVQGFGAAMCSIGWVADHPEGVRIVRFDEHNGSSAKRRATEAQRKANVRSLSALNADTVQTECIRHAELEKEKEREVKQELSVSSLRSETDGDRREIAPTAGDVFANASEVNGRRKRQTVPCPIERIADLWDEVLPEKPSVTLWTDARKASISARWREMAAFYGWEQQADGIEWFRRLFRKIRESEFLMGRAPPRSKDQRPFQLDMDWAFGPKNFTKIVEGKYHETARH